MSREFVAHLLEFSPGSLPVLFVWHCFFFKLVCGPSRKLCGCLKQGLPDCLHGCWTCTELSGHWRLFVLEFLLFLFFLAMITLSFWVHYRIVSLFYVSDRMTVHASNVRTWLIFLYALVMKTVQWRGLRDNCLSNRTWWLMFYSEAAYRVHKSKRRNTGGAWRHTHVRRVAWQPASHDHVVQNGRAADQSWRRC